MQNKTKINSFRLHKKINKNQSFSHKTHNVSYLMEPAFSINQIMVCFWGIKWKRTITKLTRTIVQHNNTSLSIVHTNSKYYNVINLTFYGTQLHDNVDHQQRITNSLRRQQSRFLKWMNEYKQCKWRRSNNGPYLCQRRLQTEEEATADLFVGDYALCSYLGHEVVSNCVLISSFQLLGHAKVRESNNHVPATWYHLGYKDRS